MRRQSIPGKSYSFVFKLFDTPDLRVTTPLWQETQRHKIPADHALTHYLGAVKPLSNENTGLPPVDFGLQLWVEVRQGSRLVGGKRVALGPLAPYALHAGAAADADTLDGTHASGFAPGAHEHETVYYTKAQVDRLVAGLQARIDALTNLLEHFSRDGNDISITGANLWIKSGSGSTNGALNGLGNLIVGYNELRGSGDLRTGSHNIVVGTRNNFSANAGVVIGENNSITHRYSSVVGGRNNTAGFDYALVSGGRNNTASGISASVTGGQDNTASGGNSSVTGGRNNTASGSYASISGGSDSTASGTYASISGGSGNIASGGNASVSGGVYNIASGLNASVSGGGYNIASGEISSVAGGGDGQNPALGNKAVGHSSSVLGGVGNTAGDTAASPDHTIGKYSAILGGNVNNTKGWRSTVAGGDGNVTDGAQAAVSGGYQNTASGWGAAVGGGRSNTASGDTAAISGGASLAQGALNGWTGGTYHAP